MAHTPLYRAAISVAPRRSWGWRRLILAGSGIVVLVVAGALLGRGPILSGGSRTNLFSGGTGVERLRNDVISALRTLPVVSSASGADRVQDRAPAADPSTDGDGGVGSLPRTLAPQSLAAARRLTPIDPAASGAPDAPVGVTARERSRPQPAADTASGAPPAEIASVGAAIDPAGPPADQSTEPVGEAPTAAAAGETSSAPVQPARSQVVLSPADPAPAPLAPQEQVLAAAVTTPSPQIHATTPPLPVAAEPLAPIYVAAADPDTGHGQMASRVNQPQIPAVPSFPSVSASQQVATAPVNGILVVTGPAIGVSSPAAVTILHPQGDEAPVGSIHVAPVAGSGQAGHGDQGQNSGGQGGDHGSGGRGH